jgi:type II secretory pathway pseudopilin PulG
MHRMHRTNSRRGFTTLEMVVGLILTVSLLGAVVPFVRVQSRGVQTDAGRADAQQTARFAQSLLDRELRNVGIGVQHANQTFGVTRDQPKIVQADTFSLTFNADLVTHITGDVESTFYDPNVDTLLDAAIPTSRRVLLPRSSKQYPDFGYVRGDGTPSGAETVSYWVSLDSSTSRTDEYVLWRRVNDGPIQVVSTGILIPQGQPFFTYWRMKANGALDTIPRNRLPVYWDAAGSLADSIRSVDVSVRGVSRGRTLKGDTISYVRSVVARTGLMNMGIAGRGTCGDVPLPARSPSRSYTTSGGPHVHLAWVASIDESGGEKDVERYALYKRLQGATAWPEPFAMVGKGAAAFDDFEIATGNGATWEYAIAAQDCSPANSTLVTTSVTIP